MENLTTDLAKQFFANVIFEQDETNFIFKSNDRYGWIKDGKKQEINFYPHFFVHKKTQMTNYVRLSVGVDDDKYFLLLCKDNKQEELEIPITHNKRLHKKWYSDMNYHAFLFMNDISYYKMVINEENNTLSAPLYVELPEGLFFQRRKSPGIPCYNEHGVIDLYDCDYHDSFKLNSEKTWNWVEDKLNN